MKVSELTDLALDWAVTSIENPEALQGEGGLAEWLDARNHKTVDGFFVYRYSSVWSQGGEIIEREGICLSTQDACVWGAEWQLEPHTHQRGNTPLEASMRCYVTSKLGHAIDIPTELLKGESK
jgi:hypothetical protein